MGWHYCHEDPLDGDDPRRHIERQYRGFESDPPRPDEAERTEDGSKENRKPKDTDGFILPRDTYGKVLKFQGIVWDADRNRGLLDFDVAPDVSRETRKR